MADEFDRMLQSALAPGEGVEDRLFVARVQAAIRLDEQLRSARGAILRSFGVKLIALGAVAAALLWLGQAPAVRDLAGESPSLAAALLILGFGALIALIGSGRETTVISAA
jgi:energy-converting hydrogenase Eha subunit E